MTASGNTWRTRALSQARVSGRSSSNKTFFTSASRSARAFHPCVAQAAPSGPSYQRAAPGTACRPSDSERNRQRDHGPVPRAGLDEALAAHLLGAPLHARHAQPAVELAVELERNAASVVLDRELEVAIGDAAAHGALRRLAVLHDVAH